VPNHTSSAHKWFVDALASAPGSPPRERYIFRTGSGDGPPNDWESIFGGPAWTRVPDGEWYLHLFDPGQPDLNWSNGEVRAEFEGILRFWLDRGVDGFRVDVAHGMIKAAGLPDVGHTGQVHLVGRGRLPYFDQDEVHDIYRSWRKILDSYPGERMAVAEAFAPTAERLSRYVARDELHQAFNFDFMDAAWEPDQVREAIDRSLAANSLVGAPATWVLSNHDRYRHVTRFGGLARARAALLLMLALPGSAYLYQGEELGLPEVVDLPEEVLQDPVWARSGRTVRGRDGCRVPLPWSGDAPPFGFGVGSWLPIPPAWRDLTAQRQRDDPDSMLSFYRRALALRRAHPALGTAGNLRIDWLEAPPGVLAMSRRPGFVCAVNFGSEPVRLTGFGPARFASAPLEGDEIPPDSAVWYWSDQIP
jgi:alpha-glucosidase